MLLRTRTMMASSPEDSAMRDGLVGERLATLEGAAVGELRAQGGEHERPVRIVGGEPIEGHLQDLDLVGVDGAAAGEHAPVVGQGGGHETVGVTEVGGPSRGVEEGLAEGRVSGLALGGAEPDRQIDPEDRVGVVGLGVEVEGLGVVAEGVGGGEGAERGVGRLARVADGLGQVDGLGGVEPVAGQFTDPFAGPVPAQVFEGFGDSSVRPRPPGETEVFVQGVLDEGVGEVVVPGRVGRARAPAPPRRRRRGCRAARLPMFGWPGRAHRGRSRDRSPRRPTAPARRLVRAARRARRSPRGRCRASAICSSGVGCHPSAGRRPGRSPRSRRGGGAPRSRRTGCRRSRDTPHGRDRRRRRRGCVRRPLP